MERWRELEAQANAFIGRGEIGRAAHLLVDAIELAPKQPSLYRALIQVTLIGGSTETALQAARALCALLPGDVEARFLLGAAANAHGDFQLARQTLDGLVNEAPKSWQIRQAQATAARGLADVPGATAAYEGALQLAPTEAALVIEAAGFWLEQGRHTTARATLEPALVAQPTHAMLHLLAAQAMVGLGDRAAARRHAERALVDEALAPSARALLDAL